MKKNLKILFLLLTSGFLLPAFVTSDAPTAAAPKFKMSKKVNAVVESKCYGCHRPEVRGEKARQKLNWDELGNLPADQQLEKMKMIQAVLEKGAMPPAKFLENMPDKKLTDAESAMLKKWAAKSVKKLSKKKK